MSKQDPERLLDLPEQDELLRQGLSAAREELPSANQLGALWKRLPGGGGGGPGDPSGPDGEPPQGDGPPPGPEPPMPDLGPAAAGGAAASMAAKIAGGLIVAGATVAVSMSYLGKETAPAPRSLPTTVIASASALAPHPSIAPSSTIAATAAAVVTPSATVVAPTPSIAPSAAPSGSTTLSSSSVSSSGSQPSDIELLLQARAALGSQPALALSLVNKAARLYPRSGSGQERAMIRIQALVGMGKRAQALAAARAFQSSYPRSGHNQRLGTIFPELSKP